MGHVTATSVSPPLNRIQVIRSTPPATVRSLIAHPITSILFTPFPRALGSMPLGLLASFSFYSFCTVLFGQYFPNQVLRDLQSLFLQPSKYKPPTSEQIRLHSKNLVSDIKYKTSPTCIYKRLICTIVNYIPQYHQNNRKACKV